MKLDRKNLKKIIVAITIFMAINARQTLKAADCEMVYEPKTDSFVCLNSTGEDEFEKMDQLADEEGNLPEIHKKCQGRRSLSRSGNGQYSYGCQ